MTPSGTLTTLYSFQNGTDGSGPSGALIQATDGNFYGTTNGQYGQSGNGTIFQYPMGGRQRRCTLSPELRTVASP
jgi:hypothetical protein